MADPKGFLKVKREEQQYRPVCERIRDYKEVYIMRKDGESQQQASRCMDCGTPFCNWACPMGNYIPEWNDLVFRGQWKRAFELLEAVNSMPEITARVCPAICEYACVLGINDDAVTIRENELAIVEYAFRKGLVRPHPPKKRTGKRVAVVGSGPAGLSCAARLNRMGHEVVVFEKDDKIGGILRYGIPDFKLEKWVLERRIDIWRREGLKFKTGIEVGVDYSIVNLKKEFDCVCLAGGWRLPRDLKIEGRHLKGIHFAMDYLIQSNRRVAGEKISADRIIDAKGKKVVVIGGGDTGADCVGVANRQGAACVTQIELLPKPPQCRGEDFPWPRYPMILKTSTSHQEGVERRWQILTKRFIGTNGHVAKLACVRVEFSKQANNACPLMEEIPESAFELEADLVIIACGFIGPERGALTRGLRIKFNKAGCVKTDVNYMTSHKGVFAAGDMRRGQSLVVWAIHEGNQAANSINTYLQNKVSKSKVKKA